MLLPVKFIAANIFISGMTAGAVCGAIAVYTLSYPERLNRLNDYAKKLCKGCRKSLNQSQTLVGKSKFIRS